MFSSRNLDELLHNEHMAEMLRLFLVTFRPSLPSLPSCLWPKRTHCYGLQLTESTCDALHEMDYQSKPATVTFHQVHLFLQSDSFPSLHLPLEEKQTVSQTK